MEAVEGLKLLLLHSSSNTEEDDRTLHTGEPVEQPRFKERTSNHRKLHRGQSVEQHKFKQLTRVGLCSRRYQYTQLIATNCNYVECTQAT
jgi:hypothetical protein